MQHMPVMLEEVLKLLKKANIPANSYIADLTLGKGGHFNEMLKSHSNLIGVDNDIDYINLAIEKFTNFGFKEINTEGNYANLFNPIDKSNLFFINSNFIDSFDFFIENKLQVSFLLADLGLNMQQLKESKRGFSFDELESNIDMRLNTKTQRIKASDILNAASKESLINIFKNYGECRNSKTLAEKIIYKRKFKTIKTVEDFLKITNLQRKNERIHPATKPFMALRIAVNNELENLNTLLNKAHTYFKKNLKGTLVIITFHSLEERVVEQFCQDKKLQYLKLMPKADEVLKNKSSRSAKIYSIEIC